MVKVRDSQRGRVYKAEWAIEVTHEKAWSVQDCQDYVDKVTRSRWWKTYRIPPMSGMGGCYYTTRGDFVCDQTPEEKVGGHRTLGGGERKSVVFVKDGRGRSRAGAFVRSITLPRWARTPPTILHELAHIVCYERPSHGRQFARVFLDMVTRFMGKEAGKKLRESYRKHKVRFHAKRPGSKAGNIEALKKARAAKAAAKERND